MKWDVETLVGNRLRVDKLELMWSGSILDHLPAMVLHTSSCRLSFEIKYIIAQILMSSSFLSTLVVRTPLSQSFPSLSQSFPPLCPTLCFKFPLSLLQFLCRRAPSRDHDHCFRYASRYPRCAYHGPTYACAFHR